MKFFAALALFVLFAAVLSAGIVLMLAGKPLLFIAALVVFLGAFIKFGCLSH